MSNTAIEQRKDIRALIQSDSVKEQMKMVLPKHLTPDRMARVACTAILKTPKLTSCKPESLLQALMLCSQAGLEPDGRNAHLIPYGDQVQVIFDWKGLVALARRNGVQNIFADVVCANDVFKWVRTGDGLQFEHLVDWRSPRGEMYAAYCIWKDNDQFDGEVMTKDEIEGIRKRSRAGSSGPWVTDFNEMAKKTVVRRASKKWPMDSEIADAMSREDDNIPTVTTAPVTFTQIPATTETVTEPEPQGSPADNSTVTGSPEQAPDKTRAQALEEYFVAECNMGYGQIVPTLVRLACPKNADSFASFADMPERDLIKVWQSRRGIAAELKRNSTTV